jgi:hypothetical protein
MNVKICKNESKGALHCAFKVRRRDPDTGDVLDYGCLRHEVGVENTAGVDHYNLLPEHDESTGDAVYQQHSTEPSCFRVGPQLIWENISGHNQNGLNYDNRDFPADLHPGYRREDRNLPNKSEMTEEDLGEIFGGINPMLVSSSWNAERWFGISNVDVCNEGIYGLYNPISNMVLPKCFKSYARDIAGWVNYTNISESFRKRDKYISEMNANDINVFCTELFKDEKIAGRMKDALLYIKDGNFINIWTLMENNFVPSHIKSKFMNTISLRTNKELYKGTINLKLYCELYGFISKMRHRVTSIDLNGKSVTEIQYLPKALQRLYKSNLLNYILNNPNLKKSLEEITIAEAANERVKTNYRYWFVIPMLKLAKKEGILNKKAIIPPWLLEIIKEKNDPYFKVFGVEYQYSTAPEDIQKEYDEATVLRLDSPQQLYAGMINIRKELKDSVTFEVGCSDGWATFCDILDTGRVWNMAEIRLAWEHFKPAYLNNSPSDFWEWIDMIVDLPYETETTISQKELNDQLLRLDTLHDKQILVASEEEVLMHGACDFNLGDGHVSQGRAFAMNLINQVVDSDTWEVQKQPLNNMYDAIARVKNLRECSHETFWSNLARFGGLKDDRDEIRKTLSNETYEEVMTNLMEGVVSADSVAEIGLGDSDLGLLEFFDPLTDEHNYMNGGTGSWTSEE